MIIGISPIKLASRELRVVSQINTLIAELLADLKDTVHSTHNQHLEVQLRCNSHEKFHVQVIMERLKGPCCGSSSNHVHHWCLNFCEVLGSQEVSQEVEDFIARCKDLMNRVVQDQIKIALPVPRVLRENLLLTIALWKHVHAVGETNDLCGSH